jgi:hypothetical protein
MNRAVLALALLVSTLSAGAAGPAAAQPGTPRCQALRQQDPDTSAMIFKTRLTATAFGTDPLLVWTSDDPESLMLVAVRNGSALRYAGCFAMTLQADGQPIAISKLRHDKDPDSLRTVVEYVRAEIPWADAQKLAAALAITYKICNDDLKANDDFLCQARSVIEAAAAWKKGQAGKK